MALESNILMRKYEHFFKWFDVQWGWSSSTKLAYRQTRKCAWLIHAQHSTDCWKSTKVLSPLEKPRQAESLIWFLFKFCSINNQTLTWHNGVDDFLKLGGVDPPAAHVRLHNWVPGLDIPVQANVPQPDVPERAEDSCPRLVPIWRGESHEH